MLCTYLIFPKFDPVVPFQKLWIFFKIEFLNLELETFLQISLMGSCWSHPKQKFCVNSIVVYLLNSISENLTKLVPSHKKCITSPWLAMPPKQSRLLPFRIIIGLRGCGEGVNFIPLWPPIILICPNVLLKVQPWRHTYENKTLRASSLFFIYWWNNGKPFSFVIYVISEASVKVLVVKGPQTCSTLYLE